MYYQSTMTTKILLLLTFLKVAVGDDAEFSQMELAIQPIRMLQSSIPCSAVKSMLEQNSVIPANTCECTHLGDVTQAGFQHYKISCQDFCHIGSMSMEVEYHFQIQGMTGRIIESKEVFELNGSTVEKTQNFLFEDGSFQSCDIVAGSPCSCVQSSTANGCGALDLVIDCTMNGEPKVYDMCNSDEETIPESSQLAALNPTNYDTSVCFPSAQSPSSPYSPSSPFYPSSPVSPSSPSSLLSVNGSPVVTSSPTLSYQGPTFTAQPTNPLLSPSPTFSNTEFVPSLEPAPTASPVDQPTGSPVAPTIKPTGAPSGAPTTKPTFAPTSSSPPSTTSMPTGQSSQQLIQLAPSLFLVVPVGIDLDAFAASVADYLFVSLQGSFVIINGVRCQIIDVQGVRRELDQVRGSERQLQETILLTLGTEALVSGPVTDELVESLNDALSFFIEDEILQLELFLQSDPAVAESIELLSATVLSNSTAPPSGGKKSASIGGGKKSSLLEKSTGKGMNKNMMSKGMNTPTGKGMNANVVPSTGKGMGGMNNGLSSSSKGMMSKGMGGFWKGMDVAPTLGGTMSKGGSMMSNSATVAQTSSETNQHVGTVSSPGSSKGGKGVFGDGFGKGMKSMKWKWKRMSSETQKPTEEKKMWKWKPMMSRKSDDKSTMRWKSMKMQHKSKGGFLSARTSNAASKGSSGGSKGGSTSSSGGLWRKERRRAAVSTAKQRHEKM